MDNVKHIIRQTIAAIEQFTEIEQTKLDAAADENLTTLEDCMTKEQAMIMRIKGLEHERIKWQKDNGCEGLTFKEILDKSSPDEKADLKFLYDSLSERLNLFQDVSKSAEQIIKANLYVVNRKLEQQGNTYAKNGNTEAATEGRLTDSKA